MFLSYDTIGYLKGPDIALVKDVETGTVAVRKKLRAELLGVYERLKSVEQANLPRVYETEEYEGECFSYTINIQHLLSLVKLLNTRRIHRNIRL